MFDIHQAKIDILKENDVTIRHINLDIDLECFILIDSEDKKISQLILTNILDTLIGNISKYNTYKDFSSALERINSLLKNWQDDKNKIKGLNIFIGVLNKSNLTFSNIGRPSWYLIKGDGELVEIIDKWDIKKEFSFISSGDINDEEVIILSTGRLLDYLSRSDIRESAGLGKAEEINRNLENILRGENIEENIGILSMKNNFFIVPKEDTKISNYLSKIKYLWMKAFDNKIVKTSIANAMLWYEKLLKQSKTIKNSILVVGIFVSIFLLYSIIGGVLGGTKVSKDIANSQLKLEHARDYIRIANENVANPDIFDLNIKKAEEIIYEIKDKKLFLNDLSKILDDITIIKKEFNGVESFEEDNEKLISDKIPATASSIVEMGGKIYAITKNSVAWPIILWQTAVKERAFDKLALEDNFKNAILFNGTILLSTKLSKLVTFTPNGYFRYTDAVWRATWEEIEQFETFVENIYVISKDGNQIIRHKKSGDNFDSWANYLQDEDAKNIGKILSVAIDGGIYILKKDLSIVKVFNSPRYRVESIMINKLPKNYAVEENAPIKLKTRIDLSYLYLFMNNKVWIFKPNSKNYQDVKSLTYIGQIEGKIYKIKDFYIHRDGEIYALNEKWIYKINFEVSDDKLILK